MSAGLVPMLELRGGPYEIGYQHGAVLRHSISEFLADDCGRLRSLNPTAPPQQRLLARAELFGDLVRRELPELSLEIDGLAAGAQISRAQAVLLQFRRELAEDSGDSTGECTSFACHEGGRAMIAQTIDLSGAMTELGAVLRLIPADRSVPRALLYSFAGLLGFLGFNDAGVAVGINLVLAGTWQLGVSPYLLVRHLLRQRSVAACLTELERIPRSSSRALMLCDSKDLAAVELTVADLRAIRGTRLYHTNHYLHPDFESLDRLNVFTRNASRRRLAKVTSLAGDLGPMSDPEAVFAMFSDHSLFPLGLCVHAEGELRRDETAACVLMRPLSGEMLVRKGRPCEGKTQRFLL
jgi:hypothetical protein